MCEGSHCSTLAPSTTALQLGKDASLYRCACFQRQQYIMARSDLVPIPPPPTLSSSVSRSPCLQRFTLKTFCTVKFSVCLCARHFFRRLKLGDPQSHPTHECLQTLPQLIGCKDLRSNAFVGSELAQGYIRNSTDPEDEAASSVPTLEVGGAEGGNWRMIQGQYQRGREKRAGSRKRKEKKTRKQKKERKKTTAGRRRSCGNPSIRLE